jgi:SWI/SNF-related matrix-associated actin-dependent regulator of chromatin subfamily A member 5
MADADDEPEIDKEAERAAIEAEVEANPQVVAAEQRLEGLGLSTEEEDEKAVLVSAGFGGWNRRDFRTYISACERFGRTDKESIMDEVAEVCGKTRPQVKLYHQTFWRRYKELNDWLKVLEKIERGEGKIKRRKDIQQALDSKVRETKNPWMTLSIDYGPNKGKAFTEEEDRFLVCMLQQLGYGSWEQLKLEIRKAWQFRFDWFFKSRTPMELMRRCETLIRLIEKDCEKKVGKKKGGGAAKKKGGGKPQGGVKKKGGGSKKRKAPAGGSGKGKRAKKGK